MQHDERMLLLALTHATFLTPRERMRLAGVLASTRELERVTTERFERIIGRRLRRAVVEPAAWVEAARQDERDLTAGGIACTFYSEERFPRALRYLYDPPLALFYRGSVLGDSRPVLAVVGTRRPSARALQAARAVCRGLAEQGVTIVSGLARGIDAAAHWGTLDGEGRAVGVLGNGIDRVYPLSSASLGREILRAGGTLVSEYPPLTPPLKHHFPARNRLISGLARTVLIVQAPARSGALITADFALQQGKDVLVHAAGLDGAEGAGSRALAESGAPVVSDARDVLEMLLSGGERGEARQVPEDPVAVPPGESEERWNSEGSHAVGKRLAAEMARELEEIQRLGSSAQETV